MLFVVVIVVLIIIMVYFALIQIVSIIEKVGILALHYALRGGRSDSGDYCGAFCVNVYNTSSSAAWTTGAALSFR